MFKIGGMSNAPGGNDGAITGAALDLGQSFEIRPRIAANAAKRHHDNPGRPKIRILEKRGRSKKLIPAKIQGENQSRISAQMPKNGGIGLGLRTQYRPDTVHRQDVFQLAQACEAGIHPDISHGNQWFQTLQRTAGKTLLYGIQFSDIKCRKGVELA